MLKVTRQPKQTSQQLAQIDRSTTSYPNQNMFLSKIAAAPSNVLHTVDLHLTPYTQINRKTYHR